MYPFSKITPVPGTQIDNSPARCNRRTKQVWTNADLWPSLSTNARHFILYHEAGHIVLNTKDEFSADEYAFQRMMKEGRSLQDCVKALTQLLSNSNFHRKRAYLQLQRAKTYDLINNKNTNMQGLEIYNDSFLGFGNKRFKGMSKAERKEAKRQESIDKLNYNKEKRRNKNDRYISRTEDRRSKIIERASKNDARIILANGGDKMKEGIGGVFSGIAGLIGGGNQGSETIQDTLAPGGDVARGSMAENVAPNTSYQPFGRESASRETTEPTDKGKKNNTLFIVAGAVLAVVVVIIVLMKKK